MKEQLEKEQLEEELFENLENYVYIWSVKK